MLAVVLKRLATVVASALASLIVPAAAFPLSTVDPAPPALNPPLVGFSFSPAAVPSGVDPQQGLALLLTALQPDLTTIGLFAGDRRPPAAQIGLDDPAAPVAVVLAW